MPNEKIEEPSVTAYLDKRLGPGSWDLDTVKSLAERYKGTSLTQAVASTLTIRESFAQKIIEALRSHGEID